MSNTKKRHHHSRKSKRHERSIFREFSFEIFVGLLFLLGVFLLFEDMEVKIVVYQAIVKTIHAINDFSSQIVGDILGIAGGVETSDIVGTFLILLAMFLLLHRSRKKAILRYSELTSCPECKSDLYHIHRTTSERIISKIFYLKIRHMKCKNCEYEGIRIRPFNSR